MPSAWLAPTDKLTPATARNVPRSVPGLDREFVDLEQRPGAHIEKRGLVIARDRFKADPPASQLPSGAHCRPN